MRRRRARSRRVHPARLSGIAFPGGLRGVVLLLGRRAGLARKIRSVECVQPCLHLFFPGQMRVAVERQRLLETAAGEHLVIGAEM